MVIASVGSEAGRGRARVRRRRRLTRRVVVAGRGRLERGIGCGGRCVVDDGVRRVRGRKREDGGGDDGGGRVAGGRQGVGERNFTAAASSRETERCRRRVMF